jgi:hypothetical protein
VPVADGREVIRRAIRQIADGGSTNLHGGWHQGVETLLPYVSPKTVSRVILLSDGCANAGLVDPQAIWAQCLEFAGAGIGTSTYGLGSSFNEDLMIGMARSGHGTSYYGESADDLMDPFREEFDLLNALCARRLKLEIEPAPGVKVTMLNDYGAASDHAWWLPDLAFGGEAWAIVRFKVPKKLVDSSASDPVTLGTIALRYTGIDGESRAIQPEACTLPVLPASAFGAISDDELVLRRMSELEAAEPTTPGSPPWSSNCANWESNATKRCSRRPPRMGRGACSRGSRCGTKASMRVPCRLPPPTCGASRTRARVTTTRRDHRQGVDASQQHRWRCQGRCRCRFVPGGRYNSATVPRPRSSACRYTSSALTRSCAATPSDL